MTGVLPSPKIHGLLPPPVRNKYVIAFALLQEEFAFFLCLDRDCDDPTQNWKMVEADADATAFQTPESAKRVGLALRLPAFVVAVQGVP